jgi:hypothetical protein
LPFKSGVAVVEVASATTLDPQMEWPPDLSAYPNASKKPAANAEFVAIFENIYCALVNFE